VLFAITSMPVGGAETLLVNLVRRMDRDLCCLKQLGPLGEVLADEIPTHSELLANKFDVFVYDRLRSLMCERRIDAVVTVGAGDKMFWGRLAARRERVPVVLSALHSTGWPDTVGLLNRLLTPITAGFIAVASPHGRYMVNELGIPAGKVTVISNGVDVDRFQPRAEQRGAIRDQLGIPRDAPVCGIVAALRPEKNHDLFLRVASRVTKQQPNARFVVIGDGPRRAELEQLATELKVNLATHFLGARSDIPELLAALDLFALTSHNEANPVSVLESLACEVPVVAPAVGSLHETVIDGATGFLVEPGNESQMVARWTEVLRDRTAARPLGRAGRELVVNDWSIDQMVAGYEGLIRAIYESKCAASRASAGQDGRQDEQDLQNDRPSAGTRSSGQD
jgi:glycosyltransferase involved in cell wall biosynthesis